MIETDLQSISTIAFGTWSSGDGHTRDEIEEVEARLGLKLPEPLRDFYATCGRQREIMDVDFHFTPLPELTIEDDALAFCAENQRTVVWGIRMTDMAQPDPAVEYRREGKPSKWFFDARRCSAFLLHNSCWQGVMALPETAWFELPDDKLPELAELLPHIGREEVRGGYTKLSFADAERRLLVSYLRMADKCYIGGPDAESLEAFQARSGYELDWL